MFLAARLPAVVTAVGVAAALLPGPPVALFAAGIVLLVGAVVLDVRAAPAPARLGASRESPDAVGLGAEATVAVRLHNPARRPVRFELRDVSPPSLERRPARHALVVAPAGWARAEATVRPRRRGRLALGPLAVRATGPLGLAGRQATLPLPGELKVYPALPGRAEVALRVERARLLQHGERSSSVRGGGTDFDSVREYHPDDEFRRINWRATARSTRPVANVYREERNQRVVLLLDAGRTMAGTVEGVSRFEHGIDAVFAVADLAVRVGDHVGLEAFGRDAVAFLPARGGRAQLPRILDALFDLEPSLDAAGYGTAFARVLSRQRRRAMLLLVTELAHEGALGSLFAALPLLLSRHLVVVGSVRDPAIEAAARLEPTTSEEAYLKAAAAEALLARERAVARLHRLGAVVVDRPPGRLAGALADAYLRIKAFGRL